MNPSLRDFLNTVYQVQLVGEGVSDMVAQQNNRIISNFLDRYDKYLKEYQKTVPDTPQTCE